MDINRVCVQFYPLVGYGNALIAHLMPKFQFLNTVLP